MRYARHHSLPGIGQAGQEKLGRAAVLIVGMGGLGCPAATYLAAAGVGRLVLNDFDRVDITNLQRQTLYREADAGQQKAEVAARRLEALNPVLEQRFPLAVAKLQTDKILYTPGEDAALRIALRNFAKTGPPVSADLDVELHSGTATGNVIFGKSVALAGNADEALSVSFTAPDRWGACLAATLVYPGGRETSRTYLSAAANFWEVGSATLHE